MEYVIGIDSGGTKTIVSVYDSNLNFVDEYYFGTGNINQIQEVGFEKLIMKIYSQMEKYLPKTLYITFGIPGYSEIAENDKIIETIIGNKFESINYEIVNDIDVASFGALNFENGINVIAGTGSLAQLNLNGIKKRVGGWGPLFGDEGSAYEIGTKILRLYAKQADGRKEESIITKLINEKYNISDPYDIIKIVYTSDNSRTLIASFCVLGVTGMQNGCLECKAIFDDAVNEILEMVETLNEGVTEQLIFSYTGGVFNVDYIVEQVKTKVNSIENLLFRIPVNSAHYGAVLNSYKQSIIYKEE